MRLVPPFLAYQAVFREGIKPNRFIQKVYTDDLKDKFIEMLEEAGANEIETGVAHLISGKFG